jgi:hypothetical protein
MLVRIWWLKYIADIEVRWVGYLYNMDLINAQINILKQLPSKLNKTDSSIEQEIY